MSTIDNKIDDRSEFGISYDVSEVKEMQEWFRRIERHGGNVAPPLKRFGAYYTGEIDKAFRGGGRAGGKKWAPLRVSTLISRKMLGKKAGRIEENPGSRLPLQVTGGYRRSYHTTTLSRGTTHAQSIYSTHPLAPIHEQGADVPAHEIVAKNRKALMFPARAGGVRIAGGGKSVGGFPVAFRKKVKIPAFKIPARPAMELLDRDKDKLFLLTKKHLDNVRARSLGGVKRRSKK